MGAELAFPVTGLFPGFMTGPPGLAKSQLAGMLVPVTHDFPLSGPCKSWVAGPSPAMTREAMTREAMTREAMTLGPMSPTTLREGG